MEQYVSKSALVAEIIHKIKVLEAFVKNFDGISDKVEKAKNKIEALGDTLLFIENLEVKEVDLEKIINDYFKDWKFDEELDIMVKPNNYSVTFDDIKEVAKHFFELGMQVSNKVQKGEEI